MTGTDMTPEQAAMKPASRHTIEANAQVRNTLPFTDRRSFENAKRGFIATLSPMTIQRSGGRPPAYDLSQLDFLEGDCPDTVNPSLWRQAQLNAQHHGL